MGVKRDFKASSIAKMGDLHPGKETTFTIEFHNI